jgi:nucleoside-diphosphate-sugar epimerase
MKVLITGGAGYIGTVLVGELLKKKFEVRVFDNLLFGDNSLQLFRKNIEVIKGDIRSISNEVLRGIDAVIHQAGLSNDPMADFDPKANYEINTLGTIHLAKLCKKSGIKQFTFASSASIYNKSLLYDDILQDENSKVVPKAAYSSSKYKAEQELLKLADRNFCPIIFRQGTVYGFSPRMRYDLVVNTMVKTALSEGKIYLFCGGVQWRPLIDVQDVALAHIRALELPEQKVCGEIFNLLYKNYLIKDVAEIVKREIEGIIKKRIDIVVDYASRKDRSYKISGNKIKKKLNWSPKKTIKASIQNMILKIKKYGFTDFSNLQYYNIEWLKKHKTLI